MVDTLMGNRWQIALTMALGMITGLLAATLLGLILRPVSVDQPIGPEHLLAWGQRWGFLLGSLLTMASVIGSRPLPSLRGLFVNVTIALLMLITVALLMGLITLAIQRLGWYGESWDVPSRTGYALRLGTTTALEWLGPVVAIVAAAGIWRERQQQR